MTPQKQPCCCLKQEEGAERAITLSFTAEKLFLSRSAKCSCGVTFNVSGVEKHSGFSITPKMVLTACAAIYYSDLLLYLYNELSPYELKKGETLDKVRLWNSRLSRLFEHGKAADPISMCVIFRKICESFATINCDKSRSIQRSRNRGALHKFCALGNGETEIPPDLGCQIYERLVPYITLPIPVQMMITFTEKPWQVWEQKSLLHI